nr:hypothetical protein [uncultured Pedobacter sp.]
MLKIKTLRLMFTFYMSFFVTAFVLTLVSAYMLSKLGSEAFTLIFWFKMISYGIIVYYINNYKKKEFYYYQNLGIAKLTLWLGTLTFDFLLFVAFLIYAAK